jgi:YgiT-type zinc finger domain-containing protein
MKSEIKKLGIEKLMEKSCSDCGGVVRRKAVTQNFERGGVKIIISGFKAWTCISCGEIYFAPGSVDKLAQAANALFALADKERQKITIRGNIVLR